MTPTRPLLMIVALGGLATLSQADVTITDDFDGGLNPWDGATTASGVSGYAWSGDVADFKLGGSNITPLNNDADHSTIVVDTAETTNIAGSWEVLFGSRYRPIGADGIASIILGSDSSNPVDIESGNLNGIRFVFAGDNTTGVGYGLVLQQATLGSGLGWETLLTIDTGGDDECNFLMEVDLSDTGILDWAVTENPDLPNTSYSGSGQYDFTGPVTLGQYTGLQYNNTHSIHNSNHVKSFGATVATTTVVTDPMSLVVDSFDGSFMDVTVTNIPGGQTFHLRGSTNLETFDPLNSPINFNGATPMPIPVPLDPSTNPKFFLQVFEGTSP